MNPPRDVLQSYPALSSTSAHFLGGRGGFSGAWLWRLETPAGDFCLKAWPADGMTIERLTRIHHLLSAAHRSGVDFVAHVSPTSAGPTLVASGGRVWDCSTWLSGVADFHDGPSGARLQSAATALARLHIAWQNLQSRIGPCPVVKRRLDALRSWQDLVAGRWPPNPAWDDPIRPWAERAWHLLPRAAPQAARALIGWLDVPLPLHPCWCDPWHDHVLFVGDRVSGLIDYGAVKEDHAAIDLARMLGSLVGNDMAAWQVALAAYRAIRPLSDREAMLALVLERAGLVNALVTWLRWLYHDGRVFEDRGAIARRLQTMVKRLDNELAAPGRLGVS